MNIYVGNLPYTVTEESLKEMFLEYGEVESAKVIMDRQSGRPKGFGFVEMPSNSEADRAIKGLNGKLIEGMNIKVNQANPGGKKTKRPAFRNRY
jgi:RNA recognition motif-containing protein